MKIVVRIGTNARGRIVASVTQRDNGKYGGARCRRMAERIERLLREVLADRLEDGVQAQFKFYVEPRSVKGAGSDTVATCWSDYEQMNGCPAYVAQYGLNVYRAVLREGESCN